MIQQQILMDFTAGELSPAYKGRPDLQIYNRGALLMQNTIPQIPGGFAFRGGLYRVSMDGLAGQCIIYPLIIDTSTSYILEFGSEYIRFWKDGNLLKNGGTPIQVTTPYTTAQLPELYFTQTGYNLIITHRYHPVKKLTFNSIDDFSFGDMSFTGNAGDVPFQSSGHYPAVCAMYNGRLYLASTTLNPTSIWASKPYDIENFVFFETVESTAKQLREPVNTWTANTTSESAILSNISEDKIATLMVGDKLSGSGIPDTAYIQSIDAVNNQVVMTVGATVTATGVTIRSGWHDPSIPEYEDVTRTRDVITEANAFEIELASDQNEVIIGLVAGKDLVVHTTTGERIIPSGVTATSLACLRQTAYGAAPIQPFLFAESLIFVEAGSKTIREYFYRNESGAYQSPELTFQSGHLFNSKIKEIDYQNTPLPIIWALLENGEARGCVYSRHNGISGWFRLVTPGAEIKSIAVIPSAEGDQLYCAVRRGVNWSLERLGSEGHLDGSRRLTKSAGQVTGITWLSGAATAVYGSKSYPITITGGSAPLSSEIPNGVEVLVGLPYAGDVVSMPTQVETPLGPGPMRKRAATRALIRVLNSYPPKIGTQSLEQAHFTGPASGDYAVPLKGNWDTEGSITVRMDIPFDLHVLAVSVEIDAGG